MALDNVIVLENLKESYKNVSQKLMNLIQN